MAALLRGLDAPRWMPWLNGLGLALLCLLLGLGLWRARCGNSAGMTNEKFRKNGIYSFLQRLTVRQEALVVLGITLLAAALRLYRLADYPMGLHYDEASIAYDAWCMAEYGTDRLGYQNPVYLMAWGSGQNAGYLYLIMPLIKWFGLSAWTIRLPQAVLGALVAPCGYLLLRRSHGRLAAGCFALLFAISPWHIMASRWGLEVYPAVLCMLGGLCLWQYAVPAGAAPAAGAERPGLGHRPWMVLPAFALWAAALYFYISMALFLLVFLAGVLGHALWKKRVRLPWLLGGAALGLAIALPLLLFVAVNNGLLPEIRSALFSVPKLESWRQDEIGAGLGRNALGVLKLLALQMPGWNTSYYDSFPGFGIVYLFSLPLMLYGVGSSARRALAAVRAKQPAPDALWLWWLAAALLYSLLVYPNTLNRCMPLDVAYILFTALGLARGMGAATGLGWAGVGLYAAGLTLFMGCYLFSYAPTVAEVTNASLPAAYQTADAVAGGRQVLVTHYAGAFGSRNSYPYICLNRRTPPADYRAQYETNRLEEYGETVNFDNYYLFNVPFEGVAPYGADKVYVLSNIADAVQEYEDAGFTVQRYDYHSVAWMEGENGE